MISSPPRLQHFRSAVTLVLALLVACSESPTSSGAQPSDDHNPALRAKVAQDIRRPENTVSVFLHYSAASEASSRDFSSQVEAVAAGMVYGRAFHDRPARVVAVDVDRSMIDRLKGLTWVSRYEVDSSRTTITGDSVSWGLGEIQATTVHSSGNTGWPHIIVILDGGVNCDHPDLAGRVIGGWDYLTGTETYCFSQNTRGVNHGTAVAGILSATYNGSGIVGVAPSAVIWSYRVCDDLGSCSPSAIYGALRDARVVASVVSASVGNCGQTVSGATQGAIEDLWYNGVPSVFSAGNGTANGCACNGTVSGYARAPFSIGVAAHFSNGEAPECYQYGSGIDLSAPTLVATDSAVVPLLMTFGGTSAAAPFVAGTLALVRVQYPSASVSEIVDRVVKLSVVPAGTPGWDGTFGNGLLNAYRAVNWLTNVYINGPTAPPGGSANWWASYTGGVAPISFLWERSAGSGTENWVTVSTASNYTATTNPNTTCFELRVTVSSAAMGNSVQSAPILVNSNPDACVF
jgi:subtilisin family serine protease